MLEMTLVGRSSVRFYGATHRLEVGPTGWLEVAVQHGGVEIEAVGPYHRPAFWVDRDLREKVRIVESGEDGSLVPTDEEFELTYQSVIERDPHDVALRHIYDLDVWDPVLGLHGSGSIVPGGWFAFAFSHAASSSTWWS